MNGLSAYGNYKKGKINFFSSINIKEKDTIARLESLGYEKFGKQKGGIQDYRIQLNAAQRKALDEIEDGAFAIKATGDLMLNDLTAYKFYRDINTKFGYANASELERLRKLSTNKKISLGKISKIYKNTKIIKLEQNYRNFDYESPWEGTKYIKEEIENNDKKN